MNLKNCFTNIQFYNYLKKSIEIDSNNKPDLIIFPENINLCLLFAINILSKIQTKTYKNKIENILDYIISKLNLNFLLEFFKINRQKDIIIETARLLAIEYNCYISTGTYYQKLNGKFYNSYSLINPNGIVVAEYHKYKLLGIEKALKIQSVYNPQLIKTDKSKISFCVCYDLNDEQYIRDIAYLGCDILIAPSNGWRLYPGYPFDIIKERPQVQRAQENYIFIFRPYCAGWLLPLMYFQGHTHAVDRRGRTIAESKTPNRTETMITKISI